MKITEFPQVDNLIDGNVFLVDGPNGTKIVPVVSALLASAHLLSAEIHRMIFRGKNLGNKLTSEQLAHIQDGTFEDLWLGDYWKINNVIWRIVDFNYWMNSGDTALTKPHVLVMPDHALYNAQMNTSNMTTGAYTGSAMFTSNLAAARTAFKNAFGSAVITHREIFTNATTNGYPSSGAWVDSYFDLANEIMMYGTYCHAPAGNGSTIPYRYTIDKTQLALMMIVPKFINPHRENIWLRDVVSAADFAIVDSCGYTSFNLASFSYGVRPIGAIG